MKTFHTIIFFYWKIEQLAPIKYMLRNFKEIVYIVWLFEWVSKWLLFNVEWTILQQYQSGTGPGENHRPVASHWQTLSYNVVRHALIEII